MRGRPGPEAIVAIAAGAAVALAALAAPATARGQTATGDSPDAGDPAAAAPEPPPPPALDAPSPPAPTDALAEPPPPGRAVVEHDPDATTGAARPRPSAPARRPPPSPSRLPGDFTARPVVLPRGTLQLGFDVTLVFLDATPLATYLPELALGVADDVEVGITVPTRYDRGENAWTALDPAPHVAVRLVEAPAVELAARAALIIPVSSDARAHLEVMLPLRWRPAPRVRVDTGAGVELGFDDRVEGVIRLPLGLSFQLLPWLFAGARVAGDLGWTEGREPSLDAEAYVGLTVQDRGVAFFDLLARFFAVNLGGGGRDASTDGGGVGIMARFYPQAFRPR